MIGGNVFDTTPDLTPELEWMLQTNQVSAKLIAEALVDEYYSKLILLAEIVLGDSKSAQNVAIETIYKSIQDRDLYWSDQSTVLFVYTQAIKVLCQMTIKAGILSNLSDRLPYLLSHHQGKAVEMGANPDKGRLSSLDSLGYKDRASLYFVDVERLSTDQISIILKEKRSLTENRLKRSRNILKNNMDGGVLETLGIERLAVPLYEVRLTQEVSAAGREQVVSEILERIQFETVHKEKQDWIGRISVGIFAMIAVVGLFWITNLFASRKTPTPLIPERVIVTQIVRVPIYISETPIPIASPTPLNLTSDSNDIKAALQQSAVNWDRLWLDGITVQYGLPGYEGPTLIRRDQVWISQPDNSLVISGKPEQGADQVWFSRDGKVYDVNLRTGDPVLYDFQADHIPVYSGFADFIFPESQIINTYTYQPVVKEQLASREVLVVEEFNSSGSKTSRLWIDTITGNILRRIRFADDEYTVTQDRLLLSIGYDVEIPDRMFNRNQLPTNFVVDHLGRSGESSSSILAALDLIIEDSLEGLVSAPLIFDPADVEFRMKREYSPLSAQFTLPFNIDFWIDRNLPEEA